MLKKKFQKKNIVESQKLNLAIAVVIEGQTSQNILRSVCDLLKRSFAPLLSQAEMIFKHFHGFIQKKLNHSF